MKAITLSMQSEVLPDDYPYFLVLDDNLHPDSTTWNNPWYLAIVGKHGEIIEQSTQGHPSVRSALFGKCFESGILYGMVGTLAECKWWKSISLSSEACKQFDKDVVADLKSQGKPNTMTTDIPKMVTGPIDDFVKAYANSEEVFIKQADRKVAQSQAAINSKRIYKLEQAVTERKGLVKQIAKMQKMLDEFDKIKKELDQARELQKLLKKLR